MARRAICILGLLLACLGARLANAQVPPPPPPSPTLWSFLGIPQAFYKINAQLLNRRGNMPRLEKKPPLKAIADVANLKSDVPAIKAAAEIKQAEDLKPQKIKAIKYLATIGCGCYDKDGKVTKALLAAMEDCTEEVRLEAVRAISVAASGEQCVHCKQRSCCSETVVAQLSKMAYERDDMGCFVEASERVREAAIEALGVCCADRGGLDIQPTEAPRPEGTDAPPPVEGGNTEEMPPKPPIDNPEVTNNVPQPQFQRQRSTLAPITQLTSSRRRAEPQSEPTEYVAPILNQVVQGEAPVETPVRQVAAVESSSRSTVAPVYSKVQGTVTRINHSMGIVQLQLNNRATLPIGYSVKVFHRSNHGAELSAILKIIETQPGMATAQLVGSSRTHQFSAGEVLEVLTNG